MAGKCSTYQVSIGQRFNRWTVIGGSEKRDGRTVWHCRCECGKESFVNARNLHIGQSKSCGCYSVDLLRSRLAEHCLTDTAEHKTWREMIRRCYDKKRNRYHLYGGRGIKVCQRWLDSFENFLEDMGLKPSPKHTIDRYPNKDGDYEPGNCRWATQKQQQRNRRNNTLVTINGETKCLQEWIELRGMTNTTAMRRIREGMTAEQALMKPVGITKEQRVEYARMGGLAVAAKRRGQQ